MGTRVTDPRFDDVIHPSTRLTLVSTLAATDWAEFAFLRERLGMSDSALSKQLSTLEDAGYVLTERRPQGRRRTVRVQLTTQGRDAFTGHVAALRAIVDAAVPADGDQTRSAT
jgi:DNA-binding MarR family transcriptional regulator